jgi:putative N6-adenine-specific DNA methylase
MGQRRNFFATTTGDVQKLLAKELSVLTGISGVKINKGSVEFEGEIQTGLEALMRLRTPLRVMERVAIAKNINSKDALHSWISSVDWEERLTAAHTLKCDTVLGRENSPDLSHSHFTSLTIKNAIVDQFRNKAYTRPNVDVVDPDLPLLFYLHKGVGTLYRVWSGEKSLHKRGYRPDVVHKAALRETTAAAL